MFREFRKGDKVTVTNGGTDNPGTEGKEGVVFDDGAESGGLIAVKGVDGRLTEAVKGYRGYTADQLTHSD
jgi:hypothetical protein